MNNKEKIYTDLSQDESDRMQKYLREISKIYGIRLAEIGEFLGKKLKDHVKGEHQWFMAFMIIDEIFDDMLGRIMGAIEDKDNILNDDSRRELIVAIIRETQDRVKEELPLPKQDEEGKSIW